MQALLLPLRLVEEGLRELLEAQVPLLELMEVTPFLGQLPQLAEVVEGLVDLEPQQKLEVLVVVRPRWFLEHLEFQGKATQGFLALLMETSMRAVVVVAAQGLLAYPAQELLV